MQVRPGGIAGAAHISQDLALNHGLPGRDERRLQVLILRFQPAAVVKHDIVALFSIVVGGGHDAIGNGVNLRALLSGKVNAGVAVFGVIAADLRRGRDRQGKELHAGKGYGSIGGSYLVGTRIAHGLD